MKEDNDEGCFRRGHQGIKREAMTRHPLGQGSH